MSAEIMSKLNRFLGFGTQDEYDEEDAVEQNPRSKIVGLPSPAQTEMLVLEPRSFDDALAILTHLEERRTVILNLHALAADQEQRLVDFVAGATHALHGHQERVSEHIFAFSPSNVKINAQRQNEQPWGLVNGPHKDLAYKVK